MLILQKSGAFIQRPICEIDTFYAKDKANFYFATDLDFIFSNVKPEYDQKMLAHMFSVYGWYTPKGLTIYKNVKQMKVGEIIAVSGAGISSEMIKFKPLEIEDYSDKDPKTYYNILREAVIIGPIIMVKHGFRVQADGIHLSFSVCL